MTIETRRPPLCGECGVRFVWFEDQGLCGLCGVEPVGCAVPDCTGRHEARGLCKKHYKRLMRTSTTGTTGTNGDEQNEGRTTTWRS